MHDRRQVDSEADVNSGSRAAVIPTMTSDVFGPYILLRQAHDNGLDLASHG